MIKLTFEGANISEVNESIQTYLASAGTVGAAVEAATDKKKKTTTVAPKEEKLTLEKIQLKCSSLVENSADKPGTKAAIKELMSEFMVSKIPELEESEYAGFMAKLEEL
jgi:broad specificity polyphosphatase/5'/3'-nucleotidase SurE